MRGRGLKIGSFRQVLIINGIFPTHCRISASRTLQANWPSYPPPPPRSPPPLLCSRISATPRYTGKYSVVHCEQQAHRERKKERERVQGTDLFQQNFPTGSTDKQNVDHSNIYIWYTTRHRACQYGEVGKDRCLQISLLGVEYFVVIPRKGDLYSKSAQHPLFVTYLPIRAGTMHCRLIIWYTGFANCKVSFAR